MKAWKRSWLNNQSILAFANLGVAIGFIILAWSKYHFLSYLWMIGIVFVLIICFIIVMNAPYIMTSDEQISIYNYPFWRPNTIYWDQITGYEPSSPHISTFITVKYQDTNKESSQTIDLGLLRGNQRNEFLQFLETRLDFLKQSEVVSCFECGNLIGPQEDSCSRCGWSWEKKKEGGRS